MIAGYTQLGWMMSSALKWNGRIVITLLDILTETSSCRIQSEVPNLQIRTEHQNTNKYRTTIPSCDCESCNYGPQVARKNRRILSDCRMVEGEKLELCCVSRVKRLSGLFLMEPIPEDIDFLAASNYLEMMADLRKTILVTPEQVLEL
jgi:hypothetical protein